MPAVPLRRANKGCYLGREAEWISLAGVEMEQERLRKENNLKFVRTLRTDADRNLRG